MRHALPQRALGLAIRGYRRWLSGRGPLRRVRCTFHDSESCSAFGLRAAREAPGVWSALGRIRRRVRRCGETSVYSLQAPDGGPALGWGVDHDRPLEQVAAALLADGEGESARSRILAARELTARWRGAVVDVLALRQLRRGLPRAQIALRRPPSRALIARALVTRAAVVALAITLVAWLLPVALVALVAVAGAATLAGSARGHAARRARLAAQARSAALREPAPALQEPAQDLRAQVTRGCLPISRTVADGVNAPVVSTSARTASA